MAIEFPSLALHLFDAGAVQIGGPFPLRAGGTSSIYVNVRTTDHHKPGPLGQDDMYKIVYAMRTLIERSSMNMSYHAVCGVPQAGIPIAEAFWGSQRQDERVSFIRLEERNGEMRIKSIECPPTGRLPISHILFIDDVLTSGGSILEAHACVMRRCGGWNMIRKEFQSHALVAVDREQDGRERLEKMGMGVDSLFTLRYLLRLYHSLGKIDSGIYEQGMHEFDSIRFISREIELALTDHGCGD